jgi:hypothetical protein
MVIYFLANVQNKKFHFLFCGLVSKEAAMSSDIGDAPFNSILLGSFT